MADPSPDEPPGRPLSGWEVLRFAATAALVVVVIASLAPSPPDSTEHLDYATFLERVDGGRIERVTIHQASGEVEGDTSTDGRFEAQGPPGGPPDADLARLDRHGVERNYAAAPTDWMASPLVLVLPLSLIVIMWFWLARRTGAPAGTGNAAVSAFTRCRARVADPERPSTAFADVAGYDGVKEEIREVVQFLRDPTGFAEIGAHIPKGILLVGPPGTGKTLLARAIAGEAQVPFLSITGSEFLEMYVGVGAARVRDLFATARKDTPAIVFVDEIDAIGRKRGAGLGGGHDEREQTLNQLLAEMDGFDAADGIVVVAATNRPDILDPALLRAGRFDRQVVVPLPTGTERRAILDVHSRGKPMAADADLDLIARGTPGMSGADLANLLNEAALIAVRRGAHRIGAAELDAARDRVLLGVQRTSLVLSPEDKRIVAYHEAGHAVLAAVLPGADPVHKVTILPAGMALGVTEQVPAQEHQIRRRPELDDVLAVRLGGRAAEEIAFGVASTGGHDDLVNATQLARRMVREWGMSERLGHIAWGTDGPVFLGEEVMHTRDYSDRTASLIDEEITRIIDTQASRAAGVLTEHRATLDAIASALLEHETLDAAQVVDLVATTAPPRVA